ncbi:MAG: hypothetical protein ACI8P3_002754 [Saprospiraceae bacterium]|jgi:hypothetical protein
MRKPTTKSQELIFGISIPLAIFFYQMIFDGFVQPSEMGDTAWQVVVFLGAATAIGFFMALLLDKLLEKK